MRALPLDEVGHQRPVELLDEIGVEVFLAGPLAAGIEHGGLARGRGDIGLGGLEARGGVDIARTLAEQRQDTAVDAVDFGANFLEGLAIGGNGHILSIMLRYLLPLLATAAALPAATPETLIENDQVKVIKVTDAPHAKTAPHQHQSNRVMIYLQSGRQEIVADGKKTVPEWKAGEVRWSPASGTHTSEVVSANPVTIIELEIKKPADPAKVATTGLDPLKVAPNLYKLEFENPQVRVFRVSMPPHVKVPLHQHMLNRVVVYLTDQNTSTTPDGGATDVAHHKAGEASWGGPAKHREENLSDQPFQAVVVELKN
jgi:quercetin dioxygenase-like cupin family protein